MHHHMVKPTHTPSGFLSRSSLEAVTSTSRSIINIWMVRWMLTLV